MIKPFKSSFPRLKLRHIPAVLALSAALPVSIVSHAQAIGGNAYGPGSGVAAVVKVPKPWYAPRVVVTSKMRDTIPEYEALPGLAFKAFSVAQADGQYGGLYLWKNLAMAREWFGPKWFERVEKLRGAKGQVQFYEVLAAIDNVSGGTPLDTDSRSVASIVTIAVPPGVTRTRIGQEFQAAIPDYRKVPGLLRKYFILTDDNRFGGIYLWKDEASAKQWFNDAWKDRVRKTYGGEATIEWCDTPILLPSKVADNRPAIPGL
jgi:hypothetical protein